MQLAATRQAQARGLLGANAIFNDEGFALNIILTFERAITQLRKKVLLDAATRNRADDLAVQGTGHH